MRGEAEGVAGRLQTRRGRLGGKQEVARESPALATELLRGEGEEDNTEEEVGWAGQFRWAARWAAQEVSPCGFLLSLCFSYLSFCFLFSAIVLALLKMPEH